MYLSTNADGEGLVIFTPQDLHFNLIYGTNTVPAGSTGMGNYAIDGHNTDLYSPQLYEQRYLPSHFSHARVVGASIRLCYIGQHDDEEGFIVGSHIYNQQICGITDRDVEEGYHTKRVRPAEGLRMAYAPREEVDFEFTELNTRVIHQGGYDSTHSSDHPFGNVPCGLVKPSDIMYTHRYG